MIALRIVILLVLLLPPFRAFGQRLSLDEFVKLTQLSVSEAKTLLLEKGWNKGHEIIADTPDLDKQLVYITWTTERKDLNGKSRLRGVFDIQQGKASINWQTSNRGLYQGLLSEMHNRGIKKIRRVVTDHGSYYVYQGTYQGHNVTFNSSDERNLYQRVNSLRYRISVKVTDDRN